MIKNVKMECYVKENKKYIKSHEVQGDYAKNELLEDLISKTFKKTSYLKMKRDYNFREEKITAYYSNDTKRIYTIEK